MRRRRRTGFTLLEVMIATSILAVGTISVLMVFGTALSFAHRRTNQQQLAQVLGEARTEARSKVNLYRAPKDPTALKGAKPAPSKARQAAGTPTPAGPTGETEPRPSTVFSAYTYKLKFEPVQRDLPEAGWKTTITVSWGDEQSYTETQVLTAETIPDEEFAFSTSFEEERRGEQTKGARETR